MKTLGLFLALVITFLIGLSLGMQIAHDQHVMPAPVQDPVLASQHLSEENAAMWRLQSLTDSIFTCRRLRVAQACAYGMENRIKVLLDPIGCRTAKAAVTGDGIFDRLKALNHDRVAQQQLAADALTQCQGDSATGADLLVALDKPLEKK
jgi:hypothetical protein